MEFSRRTQLTALAPRLGCWLRVQQRMVVRCRRTLAVTGATFAWLAALISMGKAPSRPAGSSEAPPSVSCHLRGSQMVLHTRQYSLWMSFTKHGGCNDCTHRYLRKVAALVFQRRSFLVRGRSIRRWRVCFWFGRALRQTRGESAS